MPDHERRVLYLGDNAMLFCECSIVFRHSLVCNVVRGGWRCEVRIHYVLPADWHHLLDLHNLHVQGVLSLYQLLQTALCSCTFV